MFQTPTDILADLPAYCEKDNLMGSLANVSAFLMEHTERVNWLGFYLFDGKQLRLGPFQGKVACTSIALGKGVCGTSAQKQQTLVVVNVDEFPGHIVCDSVSRSEIVIPILQNNRLQGVLDVDSPDLSRFTETDKIFYEKVVKILTTHLNFEVLK
jgi:L-methionine (R)-S-oxide reductase